MMFLWFYVVLFVYILHYYIKFDTILLNIEKTGDDPV